MPTTDLVMLGCDQYALLDSGDGAKLELIGGLRVVRPCVQACWPRRSPPAEWQRVDAQCERTSDGGGRWREGKATPRPAPLDWTGPQGRIRATMQFTNFGHCGVFFEQMVLWQWLQEQVALVGNGSKALNLFGYTGCASLAMAAAGATVFHVDSAKGVLRWGQENQRLSDLPAERIRWVQEDVRAFVRFNRKRGFRYQVIYADPPAWGHGAGQERWQFESHVAELVGDLGELLDPEYGVLLLSCHTPGVQREAMVNLQAAGENLQPRLAGELGVAHAADRRILPAGLYAIASRPGAPLAALPVDAEGQAALTGGTVQR